MHSDTHLQQRSSDARAASDTPWWRVGMVWLVLCGPFTVIVAGIATMALAWQHTDAMVIEAPQAHIASPHLPTAPAMQARNHASSLHQRTQTP